MDKKDIDVCCHYGFSVNLLIDAIECTIEDLEYGEELDYKKIEYIKKRIEVIRKNEIPFKELLGIQ